MGANKSITKDVWDFPKVELHLHLDGSVRLSTILDFALQKEIDLKGAKTIEELRKVLCTHHPSTLADVLAAFNVFLPCLIGDAGAIERVAYELCEDQARNNVIYFEARYSPHLFCNTIAHNFDKGSCFNAKGELTAAGVVEAVNRGLTRGQRVFNIKVRTILCCIETYEKYNSELLDLAAKYKDQGVVAIDAAGCASGADEKYGEKTVQTFQKAAELGICRTVHAGESAGPNSVIQAIECMKAQRIGHGYRIMQDEKAYARYALPSSPEAVVHFEACPYSSVMTGAVKDDWKKHPIIKWSQDGVNFSISTDDTTCFENSMTSEVQLSVNEIGLSIEQVKKCQINAAKAAFIPEDEKAGLIARLESAFNV